MKVVLGLMSLFLIISCGKKDNSLLPVGIIESHLVGGRTAQPSEFQSTIQLNLSCTASKIGPRLFLTGAHCLVDLKTGENKYNPETKILITTHYEVGTKVRVIASYPHSTYMEKLKESLKNKTSPNRNGLLSYDIGLFVVDEDTDDIPVAVVANDEVQALDEVVIGGWGCEFGVGSDRTRASKYKIAQTTVGTLKDVLSLPDFKSLKTSEEVLDSFNFLTNGQDKVSSSASICPGDSGGPVYRVQDNAVVGVNSYYYFANPVQGIAYMNTHVRVSKVYDWIQEISKKELP